MIQDSKLKVLYLEDLPADMELVKRVLTKSSADFDICIVSNKKDYIKTLSEFKPDIVLSDHLLPTINSLEALKIAKETNPLLPVILVTSTISEEYAVEIMKSGCNDYILKDRLQRLPAAIINAIEKCNIEKERRKYLDEVIASEALMKDVEYLAHIGSFEINYKNGLTKWSDETYRILGYRPGEVEPSMETFLKYVHSDDLLYVEKTIKNAIQNIDSLQMHFKIKDSENNIKYIWIELVVDRDDMNYPLIVTGFIQDITEAKIIEDTLKESEERYRSAFANLKLGVCWISDDLRILNANEMFCVITGYSTEGISEINFKDIACFNGLLNDLPFEKVKRGLLPDFTVQLDLLSEINASMSFELNVSVTRDKVGSFKYFIAILNPIQKNHLRKN